MICKLNPPNKKNFFHLLLLLAIFLFSPLLSLKGTIEPQIEESRFDAMYQEGKTFFYDTLKLYCEDYPLDQESKNSIQNAKSLFPDLYEHLMCIYFCLDPIDTDDWGRFRSFLINISIRMAQDFIKSIPQKNLNEEISPLKSLLMSCGYYSKTTIPHFRRFKRQMGRYVKHQWALDEMGIRNAHHTSKGKGIRLAIIDTGIDPTIKEIRARIKQYRNLLCGSKPMFQKGVFPYDWEGHGTSIASLIYQIAPEVELMIIKFYERESMHQVPPTRWTGYLIAAGIMWAAQEGADIINLSISLKENLDSIEDAVKYCWEKNIVVITSMGNIFDNSQAGIPYYPACYPETIAIGGIEKCDVGFKLWKNSGTGDYIDIVAPANGVLVEIPEYRGIGKIGMRRAYGNSLATSFVSGCTALLLSAMKDSVKNQLKTQPGLLVETIRSALRETASNEILGYTTPNSESGYGLIDITGALEYINNRLNLQTLLTQQTYPSLPHEGAGLHMACSSPLSEICYQTSAAANLKFCIK